MPGEYIKALDAPYYNIQHRHTYDKYLKQCLDHQGSPMYALKIKEEMKPVWEIIKFIISSNLKIITILNF